MSMGPIILMLAAGKVEHTKHVTFCETKAEHPICQPPAPESHFGLFAALLVGTVLLSYAVGPTRSDDR